MTYYTKYFPVSYTTTLMNNTKSSDITKEKNSKYAPMWILHNINSEINFQKAIKKIKQSYSIKTITTVSTMNIINDVI